MIALMRMILRTAIHRKAVYATLPLLVVWVWRLGWCVEVHYDGWEPATIMIDGAESGVPRLFDEANTWVLFGFVLGTIAVSGIVPSVIRRGNVELIHAKPISRFNMMFAAYLSVVLALVGFILAAGMTVWLLWGFGRGVWYPPMLFGLFFHCIAAASLSAGLLFFGVETRSATLTTVLTLVFFLLLPGLLEIRERIFPALMSTEAGGRILDGFAFVVPNPFECVIAFAKIVSGGNLNGTKIFATVGSSVCVFLVTTVRFLRKDL